MNKNEESRGFLRWVGVCGILRATPCFCFSLQERGKEREGEEEGEKMVARWLKLLVGSGEWSTALCS